MFEIKNNEKNKSAVILNPERSEWVSRSHVTSVESVVNDGVKTKPHHTLRRSLRALAYGSTLKMTAISFLLSINISESWAVTCNFTPDPNNTGKYSLEVKGDSGGNVFSGCDNGFPDGISEWSQVRSKITSATLDKNITRIGDSAFRDASSLTSITIPDSVTSIGENAFDSASSLTSITIPDSVTRIRDYAFQGASGLTSITIPKGVTKIGYYAFSGASSLTSITIPDSVTSISSSAFRDASSLTSITIPEGVTFIGSSAFWGATGLTSITIPDSVTSIENSTFYGARSLTSITIPDSVTDIGRYAFDGASSLNNIMCKGDEASCAATVAQIRARGYTGTISYPTDKTSCEGTDISMYVWDSENRKCGRRNETQCNSVAKYYYHSSANNGAGRCKLLPKTQDFCWGNGLAWDPTSSKCTNTNYTPSQEASNSDTGGDDIGDVSGDFNPADCYNKGQVPYDNKCWDEYPFAKKRWTPAEAAEWLHDGNDNFVVITFKK